MSYLSIFGVVLMAYTIIALISFITFLGIDKRKNGGKISPEAPFTYAILCGLWPWFIIITIDGKIRRWCRKRSL